MRAQRCECEALVQSAGLLEPVCQSWGDCGHTGRDNGGVSQWSADGWVSGAHLDDEVDHGVAEGGGLAGVGIGECIRGRVSLPVTRGRGHRASLWCNYWGWAHGRGARELRRRSLGAVDRWVAVSFFSVWLLASAVVSGEEAAAWHVKGNRCVRRGMVGRVVTENFRSNGNKICTRARERNCARAIRLGTTCSMQSKHSRQRRRQSPSAFRAAASRPPPPPPPALAVHWEQRGVLSM